MTIVVLLIVLIVSLFLWFQWRMGSLRWKTPNSRIADFQKELIDLVMEHYPIMASAVTCTSVHYCNIHKREKMGKMLSELTAFVGAIVSYHPLYRLSRQLDNSEAEQIVKVVTQHLSVSHQQSRKGIEQIRTHYVDLISNQEAAIAHFKERSLVHRPAQALVDANNSEEDFSQILDQAIETVWKQLTDP